ncbi:fructose-bisphosphatase class III [Halanaerobium hydrogeniformans]|uniref:Fructose-1,6-bisphosphatase class 3 n=1 Tax=Halanaerobium hydrogeniformans TaxID=656519 RepID=E4RK48_HALHG|nr:fructose-bisphosphatase class III [Halanaerobium hydrogeniformans]ADQ14600.1 Fructose-bisphosphatase [Halanaerobium hydrogeniformans]
MEELKYLKLLSKQFPNIPAVSTEIINLKAILNLPKSTEHFLTDLHGEHEAFQYMLKTASGVIEYKINNIFDKELNEVEKRDLATLIFYPEEKMEKIENKNIDGLTEEWYKDSLDKIIKLCKEVSSIYTRSKVRKALPEEFAYIIEELLHLRDDDENKKDYHEQITSTIIEIGQAKNFIKSLSELIQTFAVDKLHIIGDIYDRGPNPHKIMDVLKNHHNVDIQWGNHDILWMGAGLGHKPLIATAIRIALRYGNLEMIEEGYGINMRPLARLAMENYKGDICDVFCPKLLDKELEEKELRISTQMQKAIAIIQFKLEGSLIKRRAEFNMNEALYLEKIDYDKGILYLNDNEIELTDKNFPTIDPDDPYQLSPQEEEVINQLSESFKNNDKLQEDIRFLFNNGSMYKKYNGNLLFHGCVPLNEDDDFACVDVGGRRAKGKELLDFFQDIIRKSYSDTNGDEDQRDWLWYLWRGEYSPLFGKDRMTTFLRYFTDEDDKSLYKENKNPYYKARENEFTCKKILSEFGVDPEKGHIINGHTPVEEKRGESPIKGNGRLLVIDGGISAAYQKKTGIAGYTLAYTHSELRLISHEPFISKEEALTKRSHDTVSSIRIMKFDGQQKIADTDNGAKLQDDVKYLNKLLEAYEKGIIKEKYK